MSDPEDILSDSPADFDSSFAYALHGEMRRLLIVTVLGTLLYPAGLPLVFSPSSEDPVNVIFGFVFVLVGAAFLFGGIVSILFKTIVDANTVAGAVTREE